MFPPSAPFFSARLGRRAAEIAARAQEKDGENLPVSPKLLPHVSAHPATYVVQPEKPG